MNEELYRLSTFKDWPVDAPVRPQLLAGCGFFYTGRDDTVQCYRCSVTLRQWRLGDNPVDRHQRVNPDCPVATNRDDLNGSVPCSSDVQLNLLAQRPASSLEADDVRLIVPSVSRSCPDEPSWLSLRLISFRQQTFGDWPKKDVVDVNALARAGFFYTGNGDRVRCAFCRKCLVNWRPGDEPAEEHRRECPACPFVLQEFCVPTDATAATASRCQRQDEEQVRHTVHFQCIAIVQRRDTAIGCVCLLVSSCMSRITQAVVDRFRFSVKVFLRINSQRDTDNCMIGSLLFFIAV